VCCSSSRIKRGSNHKSELFHSAPAMIPSVSADPHKPCSGNPHFPDGTQNPHDDGEAGNPHDVGGHFEFDGCPGSK
jgi:hypothetical protein